MPYMSHLDTRSCAPGEFGLLKKFRYRFTLEGRHYEVAAPRGFITDFASVPLLVQALPGFDVNGGSRYPATIHDLLYCCQGKLEALLLGEVSGPVIRQVVTRFSRSQCDEIFRLAILDVGKDPFSREQVEEPYSEWDANLFWAGVRFGGWYYWNKRKAGPTPEDFLSDWQLRDIEES